MALGPYNLSDEYMCHGDDKNVGMASLYGLDGRRDLENPSPIADGVWPLRDGSHRRSSVLLFAVGLGGSSLGAGTGTMEIACGISGKQESGD